MNLPFRFVCATRVSAAEFFTHTALGRSLAAWRHAQGVEFAVFASNRAGLPTLYNKVIRDAAASPAVLIFIHDDVHLCDFFWYLHIELALNAFHIIGAAGNKRRVPGQPSWFFLDDRFTRDSMENLSGTVAHGTGFPPLNISLYGPPGQQVKLLDGVLLAALSETLLTHGLLFDEQFDFHLYDVDFCRQAEAKGLRLGTFTLSIIHESGGSHGSPEWLQAYAKYLKKWGS